MNDNTILLFTRNGLVDARGRSTKNASQFDSRFPFHFHFRRYTSRR
jgi:hypothetical protein